MAAVSQNVLVVGAGIIGASIAWKLAREGARITLLDAGVLGGEASSAGAGMLAPGGEYEQSSPALELALEGLRLYPGFVRELQLETGAAIDFRQCGAVELARTSEEWTEIRARSERQQELGIRSVPLDREGLRELAPLISAETAGALFYPDEAIVDPRDVTRALRRALETRGAAIHEHCRAERIRIEQRAIEIDTEKGPFKGSAAVLAAGAWSSTIAVAIEERNVALPKAFPVRGHLVGYALEPGSLGPIVRHRSTYLLQRSNGFTIAGTSTEHVGFDRCLDVKIVAAIRASASELVRSLAPRSQSAAWLGFRPAAEGAAPHIERVAGTRLWLAYGHYRNGILLAPATAERITRAILASSERDPAALDGTL